MLKERNIDFIVLAGYLAILTDELIDAYPNKIMNIHPSLIPSFVGRECMECMFMKLYYNVVQRFRGNRALCFKYCRWGPIIKQVACDISDLDTAEDIQKGVRD